jgi:hypothetical protein
MEHADGQTDTPTACSNLFGHTYGAFLSCDDIALSEVLRIQIILCFESSNDLKKLFRFSKVFMRSLRRVQKMNVTWAAFVSAPKPLNGFRLNLALGVYTDSFHSY